MLPHSPRPLCLLDSDPDALDCWRTPTSAISTSEESHNNDGDDDDDDDS